MTVVEQLYEQAKLLPEPLARQALDFILLLRARAEQGEWQDLMNAQGKTLSTIWDNAEDAAWNDV